MIDQLELDYLQNSYLNGMLELTLDDIYSCLHDSKKVMNCNSLLINELRRKDTNLNEIYKLDKDSTNDYITWLSRFDAEIELKRLSINLDHVDDLSMEYHTLMYRWYHEKFSTIEHYYVDIEKDEYMEYEDIIKEMECKAGYISFINYIDNIIDIFLNNKTGDVDYIKNSVKNSCTYKYIL